MTGFERIQTVLMGGDADRTPMMLHNFMSAATEAGFTMEEYRNSSQKIARCHIDAARKYGLDGVLIDVDTCMEAGAIGVPIDFPVNEPARAMGAASDNIEELIEWMDPKRLVSNDRVKIKIEAVHQVKKEVGNDLMVRGNCDQMAFSLAMLSYGMEDFMADLLDEEAEGKIFELMNRAYEVHLQFHKLMVEAGADITSFGDSSCGPDLISRKMYLKYAKPYHEKLQKDVKELGKPLICHVCGNTDFIVEDLADVGFDGLELDYKTNIQNVERILRGKSILFGPIDPAGTFFFGTPEKVAKETQEVLELFDGKRLVIGAGCALPAGTPEENIRAFVNTVLNYK